MPKFKVRVNVEAEIEAIDDDSAIDTFYSEIEEDNQTITSFFVDHTASYEMCPNCEGELIYKTIDKVTLLEEVKVCEKCRYGYPSLS